jgi:hypothetical protein
LLGLVRFCAGKSEVESVSSNQLPQSKSSKEWREWANASLPLAIDDILKWIATENHVQCPGTDARERFRLGFVKASHEIVAFDKHKDGLTKLKQEFTEGKTECAELDFVRNAVKKLAPMVGLNREWRTSTEDEITMILKLQQSSLPELRKLAKSLKVSPQMGGRSHRTRAHIERDIIEHMKDSTAKRLFEEFGKMTL